MGEKTKAITGHIPRSERSTYFFGAFGQGMMYAVMSSYISDFYLNVMGIGAMFVFWLMLFARIWDAVNDPMMGVIMDRVNPRRGKMRSWLFVVTIPVAIFTILLFWSPSFIPKESLMFYAGITYVLWGMIYTVGDIPFWSLPNAMTPNADERGKLISLSRTFNGVGSAIPMALVMILGPVLGKLNFSGAALEQRKYLITALIAAGIGGLLYFRTAFKVHERVPLPPSQKREKGRGALSVIFHSKPLMLTVLMGILASGRYMFQAGVMHVARNVFYLGADISALSADAREKAIQGSITQVQLVFQVAVAVGMFGSMLLIPKLIERFSYKQLIISTCLIGGASGLCMYFVGYDNLFALVPFLVICSIPLGVINVVSYAMIGDALDHVEYTTGFRQNGLGQACQSFVLKLGNALATSVIVLMYKILDIDLGNVAVRTSTIAPQELANAATVRGGMFSLVSLIPAISLLLCVVPLFFYDLTGGKRREVMEGLAAKRAARAADELIIEN
ncbi:MAG: MFS transporter [Oscillospiraceae bacterium]|nr:MFS transporter [Oscillospiraceae bacterium]